MVDIQGFKIGFLKSLSVYVGSHHAADSIIAPHVDDVETGLEESASQVSLYHLIELYYRHYRLR